jgi:hypothetical protein
LCFGRRHSFFVTVYNLSPKKKPVKGKLQVFGRRCGRDGFTTESAEITYQLQFGMGF